MWPFSSKRETSKNLKQKTLRQEQPAKDNSKSYNELIAEVQEGATTTLRHLMRMMTIEGSLDAIPMLTMLGALGGYSCQHFIRENYIKPNNYQDSDLFEIKFNNKGQQIYTGENLEKVLYTSKYSLFNIAKDAVEKTSNQETIDPNTLYEHTIETINSENFGKSQTLLDNQVDESPQIYLKTVWPSILPVIKPYCKSKQSYLLFALMIRQCIYNCSEAITPEIAFNIIMESAFPMAMMDIENI